MPPRPLLRSLSTCSIAQSAPRAPRKMAVPRPPFDTETRFAYTGAPNPTWAPGGGLSPNESLKLDPQLYDLFARSRTARGQEELFTRIDPAAPKKGDPGIYKMMIGGITPRPIGFVSSLDADGVPNLAPFSYFQAAGHNPPNIFLHFTYSGRKDSAANIKATKEFTVNIISEPFIEAANYTAIDAPADVSEWALSGLTQAPSQMVKPPRVAESAYSLECTLEHFFDVFDVNDASAPTGTTVIGRIKLMHIRTDLLTERGSIDPARLLPVSRMGGITYGRTVQAFDLPRPRYDDVKDKPEVQAALQRGDRTVSDPDANARL